LQYPGYKITLGSTIIDSIADSTSSTVISLEVELNINASADTFNIVLAQVNGLVVNKGDSCQVELGDTDNLTKVIEGTIEAIESNISWLEVKGFNSISKLVNLRINQIYESQTAGAIVANLAGQAEVTMGEKEDGIKFPFYTIDSTKNGYEHVRDLARRCGFDVYLTPDGKLTFKEFTKISADHTFEYGQDIIEFEKYAKKEIASQVSVFGESPASSQGDETLHWLTKSFEDYKGTAGTGTKLQLEDAVIKTKDAADTFAQAELKNIKKNAVSGLLKILGNANLKLGDAIEINKMPNEEMNGVFQVRSVGHYLSKDTGFITKIGIGGLGN